MYLDDADVALVDADVERRLATLVAHVEVCAPALQQLDDFRLVTERRVVHGAVTVLVLDLEVDAAAHEDLDHLRVPVLRRRLQRRVAREHAVHFRFRSLQDLLHFLRVAVSGRLQHRDIPDRRTY